MRNYMARLLYKWAEKLQKAVTLDEYDLIERGWKRGEKKGVWQKFSKGKYALNFNSSTFEVSIKHNKKPRYFGVVETAWDFDKELKKIEKRFKK